MANKTVAELKSTMDVYIRVLPIAPEESLWLTIADASMANVENKSQGGFLLALTHKSIMEGKKAPFSLNSWRSHKLKRVVKATLGSEALAMDDALAEVEWIRALWQEIWTSPPTSLMGRGRSWWFGSPRKKRKMWLQCALWMSALELTSPTPKHSTTSSVVARAMQGSADGLRSTCPSSASPRGC